MPPLQIDPIQDQDLLFSSDEASEGESSDTSKSEMTDSNCSIDAEFDYLSDLADSGSYDYSDTTEPLYPGSQMSVLAALAVLFSWFTTFPGISKEALSHLLYVLHHFLLPSGNKLPHNYAHTNSKIKSLLTPVKEYHCCINDCVIFRDTCKEDSENDSEEDDSQCPQCGENRYCEDKNTPRKRFKYLPLGPRIHHLFSNFKTAKLLQSHTEHTESSEVTDIHQTAVWKERYSTEGTFHGEPRALSLSLCADGTNHFSKERCAYSMCPIVISILNLPAHLRRLPRFLHLAGVIPGKEEPKNTDPYLDVLVDELLELNGSRVFDAYQNSMFTLQIDITLHVLDYPGQNKVFHCNGESCNQCCHNYM